MFKLAAASVFSSLFIISYLAYASEDDHRGDDNCRKRSYWDLQDLYITVAESELDQKTKATELQDISERMRKLCTIENRDYNKCMQESNKQQRSDYNRCDKTKGGDRCLNRADKNNGDRRAACERVAHSDNARDTSKRD